MLRAAHGPDVTELEVVMLIEQMEKLVSQYERFVEALDTLTPYGLSDLYARMYASNEAFMAQLVQYALNQRDATAANHMQGYNLAHLGVDSNTLVLIFGDIKLHYREFEAIVAEVERMGVPRDELEVISDTLKAIGDLAQVLIQLALTPGFQNIYSNGQQALELLRKFQDFKAHTRGMRHILRELDTPLPVPAGMEEFRFLLEGDAPLKVEDLERYLAFLQYAYSLFCLRYNLPQNDNPLLVKQLETGSLLATLATASAVVGGFCLLFDQVSKSRLKWAEADLTSAEATAKLAESKKTTAEANKIDSEAAKVDAETAKLQAETERTRLDNLKVSGEVQAFFLQLLREGGMGQEDAEIHAGKAKQLARVLDERPFQAGRYVIYGESSPNYLPPPPPSLPPGEGPSE